MLSLRSTTTDRPTPSRTRPRRDPAAPPPPALQAVGHPIDDVADPRWVLAVRTAESLQGAILAPERRERLMRLGKLMGLSPFDASLVIAIVQDQARRGFAPADCPSAGEQQLTMIPLPGTGAAQGLDAADRRRRALRNACLIALLLATELALIKWLLF